jgi:putative flippase GtrA
MVLINKIWVAYRPLFFQIMRFGVIGTVAAAIHFSIVVSLVEISLMSPLIANVIAFLFAFQVSYWGHRHWTFRGTTTQHQVAIPRLLLVATSNLIANQIIFFVFLELFKLPYMLALFFTLTILPVVTFTLGKWWIFR